MTCFLWWVRQKISPVFRVEAARCFEREICCWKPRPEGRQKAKQNGECRRATDRPGAVPEKGRSSTEVHDHATALDSAEEARTSNSPVPKPENRVLSRHECRHGRPAIQPHCPAGLCKLRMPHWYASGRAKGQPVVADKSSCDGFGRFFPYPLLERPVGAEADDGQAERV